MSSYPDLHLYINGEWRKTASDLPVLNPATEEEIGRLPHAQKSDLDDAIEAAEKGFESRSGARQLRLKEPMSCTKPPHLCVSGKRKLQRPSPQNMASRSTRRGSR
jgi:hypothetical protein